MSFIPIITTSYVLSQNAITVTDVSSWGGINPALVDITKAVVEVGKDLELHTKITSTDVTALVKAGTLVNYTIPGLTTVDGVYAVNLQVNTTGYTPTSEAPYEYVSFFSPQFITTEVESLISKFWVKHACATSTEKKKGIYQVASELEVLLSGAKSLAERRKVAEFVDTLKLIQKKIELNKTYLK